MALFSQRSAKSLGFVFLVTWLPGLVLAQEGTEPLGSCEYVCRNDVSEHECVQCVSENTLQSMAATMAQSLDGAQEQAGEPQSDTDSTNSDDQGGSVLPD